MSNIGGNLDDMRKSGAGIRPSRSHIYSRPDDLTHELQKYMHILGPAPKRCLETLADLGLSDTEIARYFKIPDHMVKDLRKIWKIGGSS